jgi:hypothetical protein
LLAEDRGDLVLHIFIRDLHPVALCFTGIDNILPGIMAKQFRVLHGFFRGHEKLCGAVELVVFLEGHGLSKGFARVPAFLFESAHRITAPKDERADHDPDNDFSVLPEDL